MDEGQGIVTSIDNLPTEILYEILTSRVDPVDRVACKRVSHLWMQVMTTGRRPKVADDNGPAYFCALARHGWMNLLRWAHESGCPWGVGASMAAARSGHVEVLEWLHDNGYPPFRSICDEACYSGQLEVLQWAREKGYEWDRWTCAGAAQGGHLEVIQWARANGCPWDERTHMAAAYGGHLRVLAWAWENGCPFAADTCTDATRGVYPDVVEWARREMSWPVWDPSFVVTDGRREVAKWAQENMPMWNRSPVGLVPTPPA